MLAPALILVLMPPTAPEASDLTMPAESMKRYFERQVVDLESGCLAEVRSLGDWESKREEHRRQLFDMLGLWPLPPRVDLKSVVTGRLEQEGFVVEKLQFQSMPGLYVTANLYLPQSVAAPAPAVLYVCGHAIVKTNGISCGNKTGYQHHGIWFARHGYVCLLIDTVQLGEIEGLHHGTYREGMWWWNARGYTPAGVEAWNSIRALDYLETRPEVDRDRIGMTGRSGGGSYTWTTAALDQRVRAAAPVAGMTDLRNHVVDGVVEGHCDCMYFVNTYRWDFALNAALIAPRPLLMVNTDSDRIFPLDGVMRVHEKVKRIYGLYGQSTNLGLVVAPGPHRDTQDLQVPVFRWFNQHLKGGDPVIEEAALKLLNPMSLRVFDELPEDQINTRIQETFVPVSGVTDGDHVLERVRQMSFGGWPREEGPLFAREAGRVRRRGIEFRAIDFESQSEVPLRLFVASARKGGKGDCTRLTVLGTNDWSDWLDRVGALFGPELIGDTWPDRPIAGAEDLEARLSALAGELSSAGGRMAWFAPRSVGLSDPGGDGRARIQMRRRFMVLGQTLAGMQVWDVRRAIAVLRRMNEEEKRPRSLRLAGRGEMGVNVLYAALFEDDIAGAALTELPSSHAVGPDYLNILRVLDIPGALELARSRMELE